MNHDPLCPNQPEHWDGQILWPAQCYCHVITAVRNDQKKKDQYEIERSYSVGYMRGRTDTIVELKWERLDDGK